MCVYVYIALKYMRASSAITPEPPVRLGYTNQVKSKVSSEDRIDVYRGELRNFKKIKIFKAFFVVCLNNF